MPVPRNVGFCRIIASRVGFGIGSTLARSVHAPSVRAASSMAGSICSSEERTPRYSSGKATTAAAITVAAQVNTTRMPSAERSGHSGPFFPKRASSRKPRTVGGRTRGSVKTPSAAARPRPRRRVAVRAASTAGRNAQAVATSERVPAAGLLNLPRQRLRVAQHLLVQPSLVDGDGQAVDAGALPEVGRLLGVGGWLEGAYGVRTLINH